jgi:hypothetical protein
MAGNRFIALSAIESCLTLSIALTDEVLMPIFQRHHRDQP